MNYTDELVDIVEIPDRFGMIKNWSGKIGFPYPVHEATIEGNTVKFKNGKIDHACKYIVVSNPRKNRFVDLDTFLDLIASTKNGMRWYITDFIGYIK